MVQIDRKKEFYDQEGLPKWARPFRIQAKPDNDTLAILVHGFSSSPYVMHHLAEYMAEQGIDVDVVLLAGHGRNFNTFSQANAHTWYQSVEKVFKQNQGKYKNIYLVGHSLGADIAVCLGVDYPEIRGIVSLGISIYLKGERWIRFALPFAKRFKKRYKKHWLTEDEMERLKEQGRRIYVPVKSVCDLYDVIDNHVKKKIPLLKTPVLAIHSRHDHVSHPRSSEFLFRNLKVNDKELYILTKESHGILHKSRNDYVFAKIVDFIYKHN
jgi:carboxylesterase